MSVKYEIVKFRDGKYGVRKKTKRIGGFLGLSESLEIEFIDEKGRSWLTTEYISDYCHFDTYQKAMDVQNRFIEDIGVPCDE